MSNLYLDLKNKIDYKQVALLSLLLLGMFVDHTTTHMGISNGLYETNLNVIFLINNNLWFITDLIITFSLFITPLLLSSYFDPVFRKVIYIFPILAILIRLSVCFNNIALLLSL